MIELASLACGPVGDLDDVATQEERAGAGPYRKALGGGGDVVDHVGDLCDRAEGGGHEDSLVEVDSRTANASMIHVTLVKIK